MSRLMPWITAVAVITCIFGAVYIVAQQLERKGADDAGQRLASQVASTPCIAPPATAPGEPRVELSSSLAAFYVVYDSAGSAVCGTGYLDGQLVALPNGVISTARTTGDDRVTWQPSNGLRFATVSIRSGDYVITAGQSLAPTEERISSLGIFVLAGWAGTLFALAVGYVLWMLFRRWERPGNYSAS